MTRRSVVFGAPFLLLGAAAPYKSKTMLLMEEESNDTKSSLYSFKRVAEERKIDMGAAVPWTEYSLQSNVAMQQVLKDNFSILVHEYDFNWDQNNPQESMFQDSSKLRQIFDFASKNQKKVRGHTLYYYQNLPKPIIALCGDKANTTADIEKTISAWVMKRVDRYRDRISYWVINEMIDEKDGSLSFDPVTKRLGDRVFDVLYNAAKTADPNVVIELNDNTLCYAKYPRFLKNIMNLHDKLESRGTKIARLGIQAHFGPMNRKWDEKPSLDPPAYRAIRDKGLKLNISEIDVDDRGFNGGDPDRDLYVAQVYYEYLAMVTRFDNLAEVTSWSPFDADNWIKRGDKDRWAGAKGDPGSRAGWFDKNFTPKLSYFATAKALLSV